MPFHVIFSGEEGLKEALLNEASEPICEHTGKLSLKIFLEAKRLNNTDTYQNARKLISAGADPELVLSFLREYGMDSRDSKYAIAGLMGKTIPEAKINYGNFCSSEK